MIRIPKRIIFDAVELSNKELMQLSPSNKDIPTKISVDAVFLLFMLLSPSKLQYFCC
jgi:hypothetical protein